MTTDQPNQLAPRTSAVTAASAAPSRPAPLSASPLPVLLAGEDETDWTEPHIVRGID
ncbi:MULTISPECIES: hypothetical protein [Streptomyces]|uniref:hypothetical protein n=1 Tax=Streptomyces TaxID=1883 RepID=UPI002E30A62F|nr:hypothetical protein [Streptomyces canus]